MFITKSAKMENQKWVCKAPFQRIRIEYGGNVRSCCRTKIEHSSFGNAYTHSYEELWNSDNVKKLRYNLAQGNYKYCHDYCAVLMREEKKTEEMIPREQFPYHFSRWQDCYIDTSPQEINIACDSSCNLHCVHCRNRPYVVLEEESRKIYDMLINVVTPMLKDCRLIIISAGEFFCQKSVQAFVKTLSKEKCPFLKIEIITNGLLFTPAIWSQYKEIHELLKRVSVSIDAASKETYEKIRRGGSWETLCDNMEFISALRQNNDIEFLEISFIVQEETYREMISFVELGRKWNVDRIFFRKFAYTSALTVDEHKQLDVLNSEHFHYIEAKSALVHIFKEVKDIKIVGLYTSVDD